MYQNDQGLIGQWARLEADNLRDVYRFVLLTIRTPLARAVEEARADQPGNMTGHLQAAYAYADDHAPEIYAAAMAIYDGYLDPVDMEAELVAYFASLPGLGLAKAGFLSQLAFGVGGCLDTHNLERYGVGLWTFAHFKKRKTARGKIKFARRYCAKVRELGGCEELWNSWCAYVADRTRNDYSSAAAVSLAHCEAFHLV